MSYLDRLYKEFNKAFDNYDFQGARLILDRLYNAMYDGYVQISGTKERSLLKTTLNDLSRLSEDISWLQDQKITREDK